MGIWKRQFASPTMEALIGALPKDRQAGMETVRAWLAEHTKTRPELAYVDSSWCWCERYVLKEPGVGDLCEVCLIPDPERARVGISCQRHFFEKHDMRSLPRSVQAELGEGVCVGHLAWTECGVGSATEAQGVCDLLRIIMGLEQV